MHYIIHYYALIIIHHMLIIIHHIIIMIHYIYIYTLIGRRPTLIQFVQADTDFYKIFVKIETLHSHTHLLQYYTHIVLHTHIYIYICMHIYS